MFFSFRRKLNSTRNSWTWRLCICQREVRKEKQIVKRRPQRVCVRPIGKCYALTDGALCIVATKVRSNAFEIWAHEHSFGDSYLFGYSCVGIKFTDEDNLPPRSSLSFILRKLRRFIQFLTPCQSYRFYLKKKFQREWNFHSLIGPECLFQFLLRCLRITRQTRSQIFVVAFAADCT